MHPRYVIPSVLIIGALVAATYAFTQFQRTPPQPEFKQSSIGQPFVLSLGESRMIGNLQVKFADTTYPPEGADALSLGAEFPDPPGTYHVRLEANEGDDLQWFDLNEPTTVYHFHDYAIRFISAGGDTVTLRVDPAPRNVPIPEGEAVRKALEIAREKGKILADMRPIATARMLQGLIWEIQMTFGLDDGLMVRIDANTGQVLDVVTDSCC